MKQSFLFLLTASALMAQDVIELRVPAPPPGESAAPQVFHYQAEAGQRVRGSAFEFVRSEVGAGTIVKNAPYAAEAVTETTQTLADGNRIAHKDSTTVARDSEGRTRRDMTMPLLPGMAPADAPKFSFIFDAPTNTSWTLDHNTKTARKATGRAFMVQTQTKSGPPMGGVVSAGTNVMFERKVATEAIPAGPNAPSGKTENLGKQTFDGVVAEGTRTTNVIPAGEIGNERPIEIVNERWYSPELQLVVMSKHSDPRMGETIYRLNNLRRAEPPKSLFEVPAGYTINNSEEQFRFQRKE